MKYSWILLSFFLAACGGNSGDEKPLVNEEPTANQNESESIRANITEVTAQGSSGNYTFHVTVASDETGCDQYADWWEVLSSDGALIHRRVLAHSHPTDQPFTRSGSPVNIEADDIVFIRAHMNNKGYVGDLFKGSVNSGFLKTTSPPTFSQEIEQQQPLPNGCAF